MISEHIARWGGSCRDGLARLLLRLGLGPNPVTLLGMLLTVGAGVAVAAGRPHGHLWAVGLMVAAGACDLIDGAMAKLGGLRTRLGGILDSACDRVADAALYLGPAFYYITLPEAGGRAATPNLTLILLAFLGLVWAYLISYLRARAENEGIRAAGGFWQRPERFVTILLGLAFHHLPTALWILGTLPLATVAHRVWRIRRAEAAGQGGRAPPEDGPPGLLGVVLWRWRRGTLPFDIQAGATILALVFLDLPPIDLLRNVVAWVMC